MIRCLGGGVLMLMWRIGMDEKMDESIEGE